MIEITSLTLNDGRTYNLLIAHAWKDILEDKLHRIPKIEFKGTHNSYDRLTDSIRTLMGAQVEVLVEIGGEKYTQSIHLLSTIARPHDNAAEGYIYYRFPEEFRKLVQNSRIFARLQAEVMYCFRSKYALTLWEIVSKRGNMRYKSREEFELERFRRLLGVEDEKYKLMNDLERFVIKPALREVNAFSSYHVQLERVRVGKRVERVILTWVGKENAELKETYKLIGGHSAVRAAAYRGRKTEVIQASSQAEPPVKKLDGDDAPFSGLDELPL